MALSVTGSGQDMPVRTPRIRLQRNTNYTNLFSHSLQDPVAKKVPRFMGGTYSRRRQATKDGTG